MVVEIIGWVDKIVFRDLLEVVVFMVYDNEFPGIIPQHPSFDQHSLICFAHDSHHSIG
jgi:hypothetical protein